MMDPNDMIDTIVDAIDYAELAKDPQGLVKARRLLNNDLRQASDVYIQAEVERATKTALSARKNSRHFPHRPFTAAGSLSADSA